MVRALIVLLGGCQVVFPLEANPIDAAPPPPAACTHPDIRLCLAFEDELGDGLTTDDSANHLDARIASAITRSRTITGIADEGAVELVAGTELFLEQQNRFDLTAPASLDLWINYTTLNPGVQNIVFDNNLQYTLQISDGFVHCSFAFGVDPNIKFPDSFIALGPGAWHHVACVTDGIDQTIFVDGQTSGIDATKPSGMPLFGGGNDLLRFGTQSANPPGRTFVGQIDNVRLWNRKLAAFEIVAFAAGMESE